MRKFAPLDLSFIANAGSPERESVRNVAAMINANAGWSAPSQHFLAEYKKAQAAAAKAAKHNPTFLGGLFDLLQTPLYGVANALDESIAGHQSDSNDSVMEDAAKSIGGLFTGAVKGVGAGLRGATAMADVLPGVNINDDWQSNPQDKTRFGDVFIRMAANMSTADAMKPENRDKVLKNVEEEASHYPGFIKDWFYGDYGNTDKQKALESFLKHSEGWGIAADVMGDPLNFLGVGALGKGARAGSDAAVAGLDAARGSQGADAIRAGLGAPVASEKGVKFGEMPVKGELFTPTEADIAANGIPKGADITPNIMDLIKRNKKLSGIGARESTPVGGLEISTKDQAELVNKITKLALKSEPGWLYKAADLMRKHGTVDFAHSSQFLEQADKMAKAKNIRHNGPAFAEALKARVAADVQNARKVTPAERIINTARPDQILQIPVKAKLRPQQAVIANEVIRKFEPEILGPRKAPGTGEGLRIAQQTGRNARWSGPQQARMWNHITTKLKMLPAQQRYDVAAKILQHVEDYFLTKGAVPYSAAKLNESVEGLRLSHIANALGPKTMANNPSLITRLLKGDEKAMKTLSPEQLQAIENLKASEAVASAPAVQKSISVAKEMAGAAMKAPWSAAKRNEMMQQIAKAGAKMTVENGGGPVAAKVTQQYLGKLLSDPTGITGAMKAARFDTEGFLARSGKMGSKFVLNDQKFTQSVTRAISEAAKLPDPKTLGKIAGPAARVIDWLGARFNAAYGVADMRPIFLRNQASALSTAARRAEYINAIARKFPPTDAGLWHEAMRAAQADALTSGPISELQGEISKVMQNLFGGTGLKAGAIADSTVVGRSHLYLEELNSQLRRFGLSQYQFRNGKKVKDALGNKHDFSHGTDWLKSWEIWDIKKPYDFLHAVQNAVEHTVREKNMFDEIVTRFGSPKKFGDVKYGVNHPRLKGYYFTEEGARQAEQFVKILKEVNTPSSKGLQHLDHVISKIKASLTIYIPSHHWQNLNGDIFLNWIAGVNDPRRYGQAIKVMSSQRGRYGDIADFGKLTGPDALKQAIARGFVGTDALSQAGLKVHAAGNAVITRMKNGTPVTADMIYTAAMKEGILPVARVLEELDNEVKSVIDKFRPLGGRGQKAAHVVSEVRDHVPRLAQFIDGISKHGGNFTDAVEKSAAAVRKWHPDGIDLTQFEKKVLKRVFPFYSWTRKAIPLAIESAIVSGNKVMAYPRIMEEIGTINGVQNAPGDQFPGDQLFPDWIRERGIGPVAGGPGSYLVVNPSTPTLDIASMIGHPGQTALDMLNPMAKIPLELSQGATLGKQVPIDSQAQYLAMQVPGISQAGRVSGMYGVSDSVKNSQEQQFLNFINLMTGAKSTQTGIYQKSAQFDLRDYLKKKSKG